MSDEKNKAKKEVVLNSEDLKCIPKFFEFFELSMPAELSKAIKEFESSQTLENQNELAFQLTNSLHKDPKVLEIDEMFKPIIEACAEYSYDHQFDKDFNDIVGSEDED